MFHVKILSPFAPYAIRIFLITLSHFERLEFVFENILVNHYNSLDQQITASYIVHTRDVT